MRNSLLALALVAAAAPIAAAGSAVSPAIKAALADPARPAEDVARDATRYPGELLTFAGVKPGMRVADFIMGGGYWTRILSAAVGAKGQVVAYQPEQFIKFYPPYADQQKAAVAGRANVVANSDSLASFDFGAPLDVIMTVQNYHDLHLAQSPPGFAGVVAGKMFAALKPGGVLLVIDHVANADPGFAVPNTLHRIDPAAARAEIEKAGFKFEGESKLLANPADPHTANVFAPAVRGKTDQFVYKFRKPK